MQRMLLKLILMYLFTLSAKFVFAIINTTSTTDNEDPSDNEPVEQVDKFQKSLDLETRYKQLSKTLSEYNGAEESHFDIYDSIHKGNGDQNIHEGSGNSALPPSISDDEDFQMGTDQDHLGSGFTSDPAFDFSNENNLVDIISAKLDENKESGLEDLSTEFPLLLGTTDSKTSSGFVSSSKFTTDIRTKTLSFQAMLSTTTSLAEIMQISSRKSDVPFSTKPLASTKHQPSLPTEKISPAPTTGTTTKELSLTTGSRSTTHLPSKHRSGDTNNADKMGNKAAQVGNYSVYLMLLTLALFVVAFFD